MTKTEALDEVRFYMKAALAVEVVTILGRFVGVVSMFHAHMIVTVCLVVVGYGFICATRIRAAP